MGDKLSDQWQTPARLFEKLTEEFNFDIDLCATKENSKCFWYCSDYLTDCIDYKGREQWLGELSLFPINEFKGFLLAKKRTAFMNPPYSNPKPFIEKAWEDSKHCKIICLIKCDPSTRWWATFWEYESNNFKCKDCGNFVERGQGKNLNCSTYPRCNKCGKSWVYRTKKGPKPGCEVRFFPKRIQFGPPQQLIDSGEAWKLKNKWVQNCNCCDNGTVILKDVYVESLFYETYKTNCKKCKGKGYKALSGPTFPCALLIFDRRGEK